MIGTISPIRASLPSISGAEAVLGPSLDDLHVNFEQTHVGLGRNQQGGGGSLLGPVVAAAVEAVVDPGERTRARVLLQRLELPVGGAEAGIIGFISVVGAVEAATAEAAVTVWKLISFRSTISPLEFIASMTSFWLPAGTLSIVRTFSSRLISPLSVLPR
jgi:hypothetical protein